MKSLVITLSLLFSVQSFAIAPRATEPETIVPVQETIAVNCDQALSEFYQGVRDVPALTCSEARRAIGRFEFMARDYSLQTRCSADLPALTADSRQVYEQRIVDAKRFAWRRHGITQRRIAKNRAY